MNCRQQEQNSDAGRTLWKIFRQIITLFLLRTKLPPASVTTNPLPALMKKLLLLISTVLVTGCDPKEESVAFLEPQPVKEKNVDSFNKKYQGSYVNENDSSNLLITVDKIIKIRRISLAFSRYEFEVPSTIDKSNDDEIIKVLAKENVEVQSINGDTITGIWLLMDTVFSLSDKNIARHFKGS